MDDKEFEEAPYACRGVRRSLEEFLMGGVDGLIPQGWLVQNFRDKLGMPLENVLGKVRLLENLIEKRDLASIEGLNPPIDELVNYYDNLIGLVQSNDERSKRNKKSLNTILSWRNAAGQLAQFVCRIE